MNELGSEVGNLIERSLRPAIDDGKILPLDVTVLAQGITECPQHRGRRDRASEKTNPDLFVPLALLRARRERPRRRRAAEQRDESATLHSITSSARATSSGGRSRPSARAVLRLIASSNLTGCSTGRSAGLVSCKILCT